MADSEWLSEWKQKFRELNVEKSDIDVYDRYDMNVFNKKMSSEVRQFMEEALESGEEEIPGLQVRYDFMTIEDMFGKMPGDRIVINIGDEYPEFLSEPDPRYYVDPKDAFVIRPSDMADNPLNAADDAKNRDVMLAFLDRFMDKRVDYHITLDNSSLSYTVTGMSEDSSGLYSPKDSEGNYINVSGKNLSGCTDITEGYRNRSQNARMLYKDPHCVSTFEEAKELRKIGTWMPKLADWVDYFNGLDEESDPEGIENSAVDFMNDVLWVSEYDWALSDIHVKYDRNGDDSLDGDRIMINITDGEPFKDGPMFTASPAYSAKDPDSYEIMTGFLMRFTNVTADDLDKRLEETEKKQVSRRFIPSEWKDMAADNNMQDTVDKDYGD